MINVQEYARALFMLTEELGTTDTVLVDSEIVDAVLAENPSLVKLLDTPALTGAEKHAVIDAAFSTLDVSLCNLIRILADKRGVYLLARVLRAYRALCDEARGIERVEAITALPLTDAQLARLKEKLEARTGKVIIITNTQDPSIIGGIKLRYMGVQLDGSLKTRLDGFERALKETII